ncbi:MAG TPA: DUF1566 domain-containing protein, partial [Polyangiaceae bacterium]
MLARRLLFALLSGLALLACSAPHGALQNAGGMPAAVGGAASAAGGETSLAGSESSLAGGETSVAGGAEFGGNSGSSCSADTPPNAWPSWPMPDPTSQGSATSQHYTESGADVAIDDVTQLSWQRQLSGTTYTWEQARQYCDCLTLGG